MLFELFFAIALIAPGYSILHIIPVKVSSTLEKIVLSYLVSLVVVMVLLFIGGMTMTFVITSYILLVIVVLSLIHTVYLYSKNPIQTSSIKLTSSKLFDKRVLVSIAAISLFSIYILTLLFRAFLDSDVSQYYLPFAREIFRGNGLTYSTGFDYNIHLKPIGVSILYAWTYAISGSITTELFRLMPIVPIIVLVILTYLIAYEVTESKNVGFVAAIVFMLLPIHDRFLLYNAFYPDVFYYPLIFYAFLAALRYGKTRDTNSLIWIGLAFGVAGLFKAQTILIVISFLLYLSVIEISLKRVAYLFCIITPFAILVPNLIAEFGSANSAGIGSETLALLLFGSLLLSTLYVFLEPKYLSKKITSDEITLNSEPPNNHVVTGETKGVTTRSNQFLTVLTDFFTLIKKSLFVLIPFLAISSLWYISNWINFGSILYTSSIGIPNMDWASQLLKSLNPTGEGVGLVNYFSYFVFLIMHPAVVGFIWLIPILLGFLFVVKKESTIVKHLIFLTISTLIMVFSQIAYYLSQTSIMAANPRDLLPMIPMITTLIAICLCSLNNSIKSENTSSNDLFVPVFFASVFGAFGYLHSVYLYYAGSFDPVPFVYEIASLFTNLFGLSPQLTSFQLWPLDRIQFFSNYFVSVFGIALFVAVPMLLYLLFIKTRPILKRYKIVRIDSKEGNIDSFSNVLKKLGSIVAKPRIRVLKQLFLIMILASIILVPRGMILTSQGDLSELRDNQLSRYYGPLYDFISNTPSELEGDILTYRPPPGLPYYLEDFKIIDLHVSANLAYLKDCFIQNTTYQIAQCLRQAGIHFLLFNSETIVELDTILNSTITSLLHDIELTKISHTYDIWVLYELGPFITSRTIVDNEDWVVDSRLTEGPYSFSKNETDVVLELDSGDSDNRLAVMNLNFPSCSLSNYDYIEIDMISSDNALILFRIFFENESSVDIAYWENILSVNLFDLTPYHENTIRGDAYISVISSDGNPTMLDLQEISFTKLLPVLRNDSISLSGWNLDNRTTVGNFSFESSDAELHLGLDQGNVDDRITVFSSQLPSLNLSDYDYFVINMTGTVNTLILFRIFFENGSSVDIAYWRDTSYFKPLINITQSGSIRGDAYIAIVSSDGSTCSSTFYGISLIRTA